METNNRLPNRIPMKNIQKAADLYEVDEKQLKKIFLEHQEYPHTVIGFEEYREIGEENVLRDDDEYFVVYMSVHEWEYETEHMMEEDLDMEYDPDMARALQKVYFEMAQKLVEKELDDVETRYIVFGKEE